MTTLPIRPVLAVALGSLLLAGCVSADDAVLTATPQSRIRTPIDQPDEGTTVRRKGRDEGGPIGLAPAPPTGAVVVTPRSAGTRHAQRKVAPTR